MSFISTSRRCLIMNKLCRCLLKPDMNLFRVNPGIYTTTVTPIKLIHTDNFKSSALSPKFVPIKQGIFKRAVNAVKFQFVGKARLKVAGYMLYEAIADSVDYLLFFKEMDMPDTFNSWFIITELHVWMLMVRATEMGEEGKLIRYYIVDAMWQDVAMKGKKLGVEHMSAAAEQVMILGDQFQAALVAYDEGLLSDDKCLASALWRRFFARKCDDPEKIEMLVKYIRQQVHLLDQLSEDDFRGRQLKWSSLEMINK